MEPKCPENLLALRDAHSIVPAKARYHVTQPACAGRIRQLQERLGVELVGRSTRPQPVQIPGAGLALEGGVRDLANCFFASRMRVKLNSISCSITTMRTWRAGSVK
ncbi:MAG TPA: LysR family transcriptional regulator [Gammaproteobacteria bacterium]|nr:LysR family transcriptional regulator [Gammaproteobacteria bacterium]